MGIFLPFPLRGGSEFPGFGFAGGIPQFPNPGEGKVGAEATPELLPGVPEVRIPKIPGFCGKINKKIYKNAKNSRGKSKKKKKILLEKGKKIPPNNSQKALKNFMENSKIP